MLFGNLDLSDEQRDQVGSIMREQMEKGKNTTRRALKVRPEIAWL